MNFLLAEDQATARTAAMTYLSHYTIDIDVAPDGKNAIATYDEAVREEKFYSLICLDIEMPEFNGIQVLRHIRASERRRGISKEEGSKILMVTALNKKEVVIEALKSGCNGYLLKPFDQPQLDAELRKLGFR